MQEVTQKLFFASDYQEGCLPQILDRLTTTNMEHAAGYGLDPHSKHARELIRTACGTPEAEIQFLVGGTQANEVTIACALHPWQAVVAATSGHVSVHEAGAIEAGGHKVIELPQREGKINAQQVEACAEAWETDGNRDHMIQPGMVYVSQPTECGTLYTRAELEALSAACHAHGMLLYVDGARLAYALAAPENDVTLTGASIDVRNNAATAEQRLLANQAANELRKHGYFADLVPEGATGEALGEALAEIAESNSRILIPRARIGNPELVEILTAAGHDINDVPTYDTVPLEGGLIDLAGQFEQGKIFCVAFTSSSGVQAFVEAHPDVDPTLVRAACIGEKTRATAEDFGMQTFMSERATMDSLAAAIMREYAQQD